LVIRPGCNRGFSHLGDSAEVRSWWRQDQTVLHASFGNDWIGGSREAAKNFTAVLSICLQVSSVHERRSEEMISRVILWNERHNFCVVRYRRAPLFTRS